MRLLTGFTYLDGFDDVTVSPLFTNYGVTNLFNFPANTNEYLGDEPFLFGHKYGPHFVASGDVSERLIDFKLINGTVEGQFRAMNGNGILYVDCSFSKSQGLSCADINSLVWDAAKTKWGISAKAYFEQLINFYFIGFSTIGTLKGYYRGTLKEVPDLDIGGGCGTPSMTSGGTLYNRGVVTITGTEKTLDLQLKSSFTINYEANNMDVLFIPCLERTFKNYTIDDDFSSLFGVNSLTSVLNRLKEKYTRLVLSEQVSSDSITLSNVFLTSTNKVVYYKVVPYGTKYSTGNLNRTICYYDDARGQCYSTMNNTFSTNVSSITLFCLEYHYDVMNYQNQKVFVYLYDEEEGYCNVDRASLASITGCNNSFFPTPPTSVIDFTNTNTLSGVTNGLIHSICVGMRSGSYSSTNPGIYINPQTGATIEDVVPYLYTPICVMDIETLNNTASGNIEMASNIFNKELFTVRSYNFIVFDGKKYPCNDKYYITGNFVLTPQYSDSIMSNGIQNFFLYIGMRKLSQNILNKVTHKQNADSYGNFASVFSDYIACNPFNSNISAIYTDVNQILSYYGEEVGYFDNLGIKSYADRLATVTDIVQKIYCTQSPQLQFNYLQDCDVPTWNLSFNDFFVTYILPDCASIGNTMWFGRRARRYVKYDTTTYYEDEHNIRFMQYPTFASETTTTPTYKYSICISQKNTGMPIKAFILIDLLNTLVFTSYKNMWENTIPNNTSTGITTSSYSAYYYYYDGLYASAYSGGKSLVISRTTLSVNDLIEDFNTTNTFVSMNMAGSTTTIDSSSIINNAVYNYFELFLNDFGYSFIDNGYTSEYIGLPYDSTYFPTVDLAYKRDTVNKYSSVQCYAIVKFDYILQLFYVDVSVSLQLHQSYYGNYLQKMSFSDFSSFYAFVEVYGSPTRNYYPFLTEGTSSAVFKQDNGKFDMNFKIYESNKVPFNVDGIDMILSINYPLIFSDGTVNMYQKNFTVSDIIIKQGKEYGKTIFHFAPTYSLYERVSLIGCVRNSTTYVTHSYGVLDDTTSGLKLVYNSTPTSNIYGAMFGPILGDAINSQQANRNIVTTVLLVGTATVSGLYSVNTFYKSGALMVPGLTLNNNVVNEFYLLHISRDSYNIGNNVATIRNSTGIRNTSYPSTDIASCLAASNSAYIGHASANSPIYRLYGVLIKFVGVSYFTDTLYNNLYS